MNYFNEYAQLDAMSTPVIDIPAGLTNVMPATSSAAMFGEPANGEGFQAA